MCTYGWDVFKEGVPLRGLWYKEELECVFMTAFAIG
jgi:hypothetical protein